MVEEGYGYIKGPINDIFTRLPPAAADPQGIEP